MSHYLVQAAAAGGSAADLKGQGSVRRHCPAGPLLTTTADSADPREGLSHEHLHIHRQRCDVRALVAVPDTAAAVLAPTSVDRGLSAGTGADGLATQAGPAGPGGGQEEKGAEVVDGADAEGVSEQAAQK